MAAPLSSYIPTLTREDVIPYLTGDAARRLVELPAHARADLSNVYLRSNSCAVCKVYALALIEHPVTTVIATQVSGVRSSPSHFEMTLTNTNLSDVIEFCVDVCQQKRYEGNQAKRHVFLLSIVETLKLSKFAALRSLLFDFQNTSWFILMSYPDVPIPRCLIDTCSIINLCPFDLDRFKRAKGITSHAGRSTDPIDIILLNHFTKKTALDTFVGSRMDELVRGTRDTYQERLKDFVIKVGASCVPVHTLSHLLLEWGRQTQVDLPRLITLLAAMEHTCRISSKQIFALEYYIDAIVKACCGASSRPTP